MTVTNMGQLIAIFFATNMAINTAIYRVTSMAITLSTGIRQLHYQLDMATLCSNLY